ncbi:MAG TPA: hypothetical protein PLV68_10000, partial [Ilumatobacteraceae bacterium]|nr:hypothetical protein [Ilumatobacteraceae bacterium]
RELVGWIRPEGDAWVAVSILGRAASGPVEWVEAERTLEEHGLSLLAGVWTLRSGDGPIDVRIVQVALDGIVVQTDDFGAIDVAVERFDLPWPAPAELQPRP